MRYEFDDDNEGVSWDMFQLRYFYAPNGLDGTVHVLRGRHKQTLRDLWDFRLARSMLMHKIWLAGNGEKHIYEIDDEDMLIEVSKNDNEGDRAMADSEEVEATRNASPASTGVTDLPSGYKGVTSEEDSSSNVDLEHEVTQLRKDVGELKEEIKLLKDGILRAVGGGMIRA